MPDTTKIYYVYNSAEDWQDNRQTVDAIIREDTGEENWVQTRSIPPLCYPPALTEAALNRLKDLKYLEIKEIKEDS